MPDPTHRKRAQQQIEGAALASVLRPLPLYHFVHCAIAICAAVPESATWEAEYGIDFLDSVLSAEFDGSIDDSASGILFAKVVNQALSP